MAGAGYKLFNTGDVLTAAQVNTYLQEQTVMVFADAAARTTALSGVLAEGMVTYLKSTDAMELYNGSAWVGIAADQTPLTTKGDLFTYSTADARLAVGNNGETLVADSSQTTGLRWAANYGFTAGKNKIINGDFYINQRGFTSSTSSVFMFDRWAGIFNSGTNTWSAQTFTPGTAPVAGYEGKTFLRCVTTGQSAAGDYVINRQYIEDVRTFAGQTVTVSFWAKAGSGTPNVGVNFQQVFGSGGSPSAAVDIAGVSQAITTSWARYSYTLSIPSISGKTIGTNNDHFVNFRIWLSAGSTYNTTSGTTGNQNNTFDIWGVQVEAGSVATAFQTATGTLAGELAACQRYYWRYTGGAAYSRITQGIATGTTTLVYLLQNPVPMRVTPTSLDYSTLASYEPGDNIITAITAATLDQGGTYSSQIGATVASGLTKFRSYQLVNNNSTTAYIGLNAEL